MDLNGFPSSKDELFAIGQMIADSMEPDGSDSMEAEVIWSAMHFLKRNPDASIIDACKYGINEWIK